MSAVIQPSSLSETLFSKNRQAVLALLYGHSDQAFYLRQVVRISQGGNGAIQRELKSLAEAGIIRRTVRDKQVYFQANMECPVFEELRSLIVKTSGVADVLKTALATLADRIVLSWIYGSAATGRLRSASDVDVLVVGDVAFGEVAAALAETQSLLRRDVNPTVYALDEFLSKLSSGHHFLNSVFKSKKIFLIGDERELERLAEERLADGTRDEPAGNRRSFECH